MNLYRYYTNPDELEHQDTRTVLELIEHADYHDLGPYKNTCLKKAEWAYIYANSIIHNRWLEAEPVIMKDPYWAYRYTWDIIKTGRWVEAEPYIKKDPKSAYYYAINIIKTERWKEAEPYIMKHPHWAYLYARDVIKTERWTEAEPFIMTDPMWADLYAQDIIKNRWKEAEPYIKTDHETWGNYIKFLKTKDIELS